MKKNLAILTGAALLAGGAFLWEKISPVPQTPASHAATSRPNPSAADAQAAKSVPARAADSAQMPVPTPGATSPAPRVDGGVDAFAPALVGAKFERQERRMFQSQTWETDLAKGLELKPGERLERRSGIYELPDMRYPRLRVDRVYRLGTAPPNAVANRAPASNPARTDRKSVV